MSYETEIGGVAVVIEYNFEPGEEAIHTFANGDPGYPGSAALVEIVSITTEDGVNLYPILEEVASDWITRTETQIAEEHNPDDGFDVDAVFDEARDWDDL